MAGSVNRVILIGNLGRAPEIRSFQNGGKVCNFSIATSESWKDKQTGERKEKTEWHNIVVKNEGLISVAERFLKKGSKVYIEGKLETRSYEKNGAQHYTTEVVLSPFGGTLTMLDSAKSEPQTEAAPAAAAPSLDDDIPFALLFAVGLAALQMVA